MVALEVLESGRGIAMRGVECGRFETSLEPAGDVPNSKERVVRRSSALVTALQFKLVPQLSPWHHTTFIKTTPFPS